MKKHSIAKLTPLQQTWFLRGVVLLVVLGLFWVFFSPGSGIYAIFSKRQEVASLKSETEHLREDNSALQVEIDQMQNDPAYLEEVARRDFGLLKSNERVYDFSRPQQNNDE